MRSHRVRLLCVVVAVTALAVALAARPGSTQPTADEAALREAIMRLQQQAVGAWLDIAHQLEDDPLLLERGGEEAEQLLARAEGLEMALHRLMAVMDPRRREPELPPMAGRFQFVEWAQEPMQYWVLDTVTGELDRRQGPQP